MTKESRRRLYTGFSLDPVCVSHPSRVRGLKQTDLMLLIKCALIVALIDRLLYRCEMVKLSGICYRMENRKAIFIRLQSIPVPDYAGKR